MFQYMAICHRPTGGETFGFEEAHIFGQIHSTIVTIPWNPPTIM